MSMKLIGDRVHYVCLSVGLNFQDMRILSEIHGFPFICKDGAGGYVLRHKLKLMKVSMKEWHNQHSQNLNCKITTIKNRISVLYSKGETSVLHDDEIAELHDLSLNLHSLARAQNSISWQKSRLHWLHEGDANSKFFHEVMSNFRHHNAIKMVSVGRVNVEGVQNIREAVFDHFSTHFKVVREGRPGIQGLHFRKLTLSNAFSRSSLKAT